MENVVNTLFFKPKYNTFSVHFPAENKVVRRRIGQNMLDELKTLC